MLKKLYDPFFKLILLFILSFIIIIFFHYFNLNINIANCIILVIILLFASYFLTDYIITKLSRHERTSLSFQKSKYKISVSVATVLTIVSLLIISIYIRRYPNIILLEKEKESLIDLIDSPVTPHPRLSLNIQKANSVSKDLPINDHNTADIDFINKSFDFRSMAFDYKNYGELPINVKIQHHLKQKNKASVSIIIVAFQENLYIERTLESIINATRPGILKEIILIDDNSENPLKNSYDADAYKSLIFYYRNRKQLGLIQSKVRGARKATGDIFVFLDAHVKPSDNWLEPLIEHVIKNQNSIAVPIIKGLNEVTWGARSNTGRKMMFLWNMSFHWVETPGPEVPIMPGGIFAISKFWWFHSGELDNNMKIWGGENIEQSVRVWLSGGQIHVIPESSVAHLFRSQFSYETIINFLRCAEVWFDEYKYLVYDHLGIDYVGDTPETSRVVGQLNIGDISDRIRLRQKLQSKHFRWYVQKFYNLFEKNLMLPINIFKLKAKYFNECISVASTGSLQFFPCTESNTYFTFGYSKEPMTPLFNYYTRDCLVTGNLDKDSDLSFDDKDASYIKPIFAKCDENDHTHKRWSARFINLDKYRIVYDDYFCLTRHINSLENLSVYLIKCDPLLDLFQTFIKYDFKFIGKQVLVLQNKSLN